MRVLGSGRDCAVSATPGDTAMSGAWRYAAMGMLGVVVALAVVGQATGCAIDEDERDARVVAAVACIVSQLCAANDDLLGNSNLGKSTMPLTDYIRRHGVSRVGLHNMGSMFRQTLGRIGVHIVRGHRFDDLL